MSIIGSLVKEVNLSKGNNCRPGEGVDGVGLACYAEEGEGEGATTTPPGHIQPGQCHQDWWSTKQHGGFSALHRFNVIQVEANTKYTLLVYLYV